MKSIIFQQNRIKQFITLFFLFFALNAANILFAYNYSDNVSPSQQPPAGLAPSEVPMFVVFGFDDNKTADGVRWTVDLFMSKHNPAGAGNAATYDGSRTTASYYQSVVYLADPAYELNRAYLEGFEIGNHMDTHPSGLQFSVTQWEHEMRSCINTLSGPSGIGITVPEITGFRSPYLEYNTNTSPAVKNSGMWYDCSIEEGWQADHDGTNYNWPYTLDNGSPGNIAHAQLSTLIEPINPFPGVWEVPVYTFIVPPDEKCAEYGVSTGLRQRLKNRQAKFDVNSGKITGFDWNIFFDYKMTKEEALATLKYSFDLRMAGNRAPFTFGTHSNYYSDPMRQAVLEEFLDYVLTKPDVRVVTTKMLVDWLRNPAPLIKKDPATGVPGTPELSANVWNGESNYTISMDMWWGNNGTTAKLYENGVPVQTKSLTDNSPNAQKVEFQITDKAVGTYNYTCELINQFGTTTTTSDLVITVTQ